MSNLKFKYTQIFLLAIATLAFVFISALVWFSSVVEKSAKDEFMNNTESKVQVISSVAKLRFEKIYEDIVMISKLDLIKNENDELNKYYQNRMRTFMKPMEGSEREQTIYKLFQLYGEAHEGTEYVYYASKNGGYVVWPQTYIPAKYDPRVRPWYISGLKAVNQVFQTEPYQDLVTSKKIISNVKAVFDSSGEAVGVVGIDINLRAISNLLEDIKFLPNEQYIIVHSSGVILEDTLYPKNNMKYIYDPYPMINRQDMDYDKIYSVNMEGRDVFIMKSNIENVDWDVYSISNKNILIKRYKALRSNYFIGAIFVSIAVSSVILLGAYTFLRNRRRYNQDMYNLQYFDSLTKLRNKALFDKEVVSAIEEYASDSNHALIIMNIDSFRVVNEAKGYEFGNILLLSVSEKLKNLIEEGDILARLGNDEFAIFKPNIESQESLYNYILVLDKVLNRIYEIEDEDIFVNISFGISMYPNDAWDYTELFKNAISALNSSKKGSRNNFEFYNQDINTKSIYRYDLKNRMRTALNQKEFKLYYQPQIDIFKNRVVGIEALLRWETENGFISPVEFIPLAEESNLIIPIGEWVLLNACSFGQKLCDMGYEIQVAVNISKLQFKHPYINIFVNSIIEKTGFDPKLLELEITESMLIQNHEECNMILQLFENIGVKIAIDDFGTGYSSLSYLKKFDVDKIKIDRSFIKDIPENDDGTIAKVIIDLAKNLNMEVIAEGVESEAQLQFLKNNECSQVQGYFYSKPVSEAELMEFLYNFNRN
ncbi:MAG: bifunctional diguanylate cyclase/phosphodiesterase [Proteocatella sp.]